LRPSLIGAISFWPTVY